MAERGHTPPWLLWVAVVSIGACGGSGPTDSITVPRSAVASPSSGPAASTSVAAGATASDSPLPVGVTVVDRASTIERLDWSPDGRRLAVLSWGGTFGTGRVDILDPKGSTVASFDAFDVAWVDDSHLMTLVVSPDDTAKGTVTLRTIDGTSSTALPGAYGGLQGNGHGSVALIAPVAAGDPPGRERYTLWTDGHLGQPNQGLGVPVRWSADGQLLALVREGLGGGGTGAPIPGTLSVVRPPDTKPLLSHRLDDMRGDLWFSPDGTMLATSNGLVLHVASGVSEQVADSARGWTPSGDLVLVGSDQRVSLWAPSGTKPLPDAFVWAILGPAAGDIATLPSAVDSFAAPTRAVVRHAGSEASVPLKVATPAVAWSADGVCYLSSGSGNAQAQDDVLLRVELSPGMNQ